MASVYDTKKSFWLMNKFNIKIQYKITSCIEIRQQFLWRDLTETSVSSNIIHWTNITLTLLRLGCGNRLQSLQLKTDIQ